MVAAALMLRIGCRVVNFMRSAADANEHTPKAGGTWVLQLLLRQGLPAGSLLAGQAKPVLPRQVQHTARTLPAPCRSAVSVVSAGLLNVVAEWAQLTSRQPRGQVGAVS